MIDKMDKKGKRKTGHFFAPILTPAGVRMDSLPILPSYQLHKTTYTPGTSVGANIFEAIHAESDLDYIHKYSIAQKECSETLYWLEILKSTSILSDEEFQSIHADANELMSLLVASLKTLKSKKKKNPPKK